MIASEPLILRVAKLVEQANPIGWPTGPESEI
jgi:hypothetical protein